MKNRLEEYEVWVETDSVTDSITLGTKELIERQKTNALIGKSAKKIHSFVASTPEKASSIFHLRMGYEPYKPMGDPVLCPNNCGSYFFPKGS